jgi:Flp pilus assembly pilin Flp
MINAWVRVVGRLPARASGDAGASFVEYALLFAMIVLLCLAAITLLGNDTSSGVSGAGSYLESATN